jgi:hypothetical protein
MRLARFPQDLSGLIISKECLMRWFSPVCGLLVILCCAAVAACAGSDEDFRLYAYPNPFDPEIAPVAKFVLVWQNSGAPVTNQVRFCLYTQAGHPILSRERSVTVPSGEQRFEYDWDGKNDDGKRVSPGTYLLQAVAAGSGASLAGGQSWFKIVVR